MIAYTSILLSGILTRYQAAGDQKVLELLKRISPVAWQHIHFLGHYTFRDKQHPIDLEAILASVNLQESIDYPCWINFAGLGLQYVNRARRNHCQGDQ